MATVLTNLGVAALAKGLTAAPPTWYIAWGTGAGTSSASDTTLFSEDASGGYARVAVTPTLTTTTTANDTVQFAGTITATASITVTNIGIFDAATGGNLIYKRDFTGVPVAVAGPNTGLALTEKIAA
jgi:hypothetical protein